MQQGCARPLSGSVSGTASCPPQVKQYLLPTRPVSRRTSSQTCYNLIPVQQLYGCGCLSKQTFRQTRVQAFRRQGPGRPEAPQPQPVMIDVTADAVSTSGREDSEDDDNQQDQRNVFRRAAAAAIGLMRAVAHWLQQRFRIQKLFDRYIWNTADQAAKHSSVISIACEFSRRQAAWLAAQLSAQLSASLLIRLLAVNCPQ